MGFRADGAVHKSFRETGRDLLSDLETFHPDARPHDGPDVCCRCAETGHGVDGVADYPCHSSAPSGMSSRDYACRCVGKHDRDAICRVYPDNYSRECCHDGIGVIYGLRVDRQPVNDCYADSVGLLRDDNIFRVHIGPLRKAVARGLNPSRGISCVVTQRETGVWIARIKVKASARTARKNAVGKVKYVNA